MSKYNDTILTTEGTRLATLAANGKTHYVITRAVATGDDLSTLTDEELSALTSLPNEVQNGSIVEQVDDPSGSDGVIGTRVQFMNQGLNKSYSMNALGVYAKEDGHDQEVLFSVMTAESQHAQYMPDFSDKVVLRFGITIFVIVGDKANVTVKLDPDGLATIKFVEDAIARIPKPDMTEYYSKKESDTLLNKKVTDNGNDTVTINKKTYVPANSANVVDRNPDTGVVSEPVDFTNLTVNGGKPVATRDDLKSLEASAWHRLDFGSDANLGGAVLSSYIIYQIHDDEKYLSFFYLGVGQSENTAFSDNTTLMDLSSIVKGISSIDFSTRYTDISNNSGQAADFKISGTKIITSTSNHSIYVNPRSTVSLYPLNHDDRRVYYTELI
ncbi:phage tail protein [Levilactobacillus brevis]|uniref:phage tail protein n=1 Tax=Levilactobacillus brevis TaxID=1580 RepID=UPI0020738CA3|nr:phage tail protein [Levilactobacillus brevis]